MMIQFNIPQDFYSNLSFGCEKQLKAPLVDTACCENYDYSILFEFTRLNTKKWLQLGSACLCLWLVLEIHIPTWNPGTGTALWKFPNWHFKSFHYGAGAVICMMIKHHWGCSVLNTRSQDRLNWKYTNNHWCSNHNATFSKKPGQTQLRNWLWSTKWTGFKIIKQNVFSTVKSYVILNLRYNMLWTSCGHVLTSCVTSHPDCSVCNTLE